jgi:hypothetical protein
VTIDARYCYALRPCYEPGCPHPLCVKGQPAVAARWFPGGPPATWFPFPALDTTSDRGDEPHYFKPEDLWAAKQGDGEVAYHITPPGPAITMAWNKRVAAGEDDAATFDVFVREQATNNLVTEETVRLWLQHQQDVARNIVAGREKAAATRAAKNAAASDAASGAGAAAGAAAGVPAAAAAAAAVVAGGGQGGGGGAQGGNASNAANLVATSTGAPARAAPAPRAPAPRAPAAAAAAAAAGADGAGAARVSAAGAAAALDDAKRALKRWKRAQKVAEMEARLGDDGDPSGLIKTDLVLFNSSRGQSCDGDKAAQRARAISLHEAKTSRTAETEQAAAALSAGLTNVQQLEAAVLKATTDVETSSVTQPPAAVAVRAGVGSAAGARGARTRTWKVTGTGPWVTTTGTTGTTRLPRAP